MECTGKLQAFKKASSLMGLGIQALITHMFGDVCECGLGIYRRLWSAILLLLHSLSLPYGAVGIQTSETTCLGYTPRVFFHIVTLAFLIIPLLREWREGEQTTCYGTRHVFGPPSCNSRIPDHSRGVGTGQGTGVHSNGVLQRE